METLPLLGTVLMASVLGSLHCLGMCGGMVAFYAGQDVAQGWRRLLGHGAYNLGRLVTYAALGTVAGALGSFLDLAGSTVGVQRVGGVVAGVLMLAWGLAALARALGARVPHLPLPSWITGPAQRGVQRVAGLPPLLRALLIGLLTTFLPCGWLYAFVLVAAGTGSAWGGALVMLAFWAGNLPWLLGVGLGVQVLAASLRRHVPVLTAVVLLAVGTTFLVQRTMVPFERAANAAQKRHPLAAPEEEPPKCH